MEVITDGIGRRQVSVPGCQLIQVARPVALHNQVHVAGQIPQQPPTRSRFQVQRNALFVQVQDEEEQALLRCGRRDRTARPDASPTRR